MPLYNPSLTYMIVKDEKTSGTAGGGSSAGANTRDLNTVEVNTITGASLSSNQVTLPAGIYSFEGSAPAFNIASGGLKSYIYNTTDAAVSLIGQSAYASSATNTTVSEVFGIITIASQKVFEFRQYIASATATNGLGVAVTSGTNEVYAILKITKIGY